MADITRNKLSSQRPSHEDGSIAEPAPAASVCCGGPAPRDTNACCVRDADAKATGAAGCGCGSAPVVPARQSACCR